MSKVDTILFVHQIMLIQFIRTGRNQNLIIVNTAGHSSSDEGILENMLDGLEI